VIVAGANVGVQLDSTLLSANDERRLRIRLQSDGCISDMNSLWFEALHPFEVIFLVETSLEFDHCSHLFPVVSSVDETLHYLRGARCSVDCGLHREKVWIICGRVEEPLHRTLEGVTGLTAEDLKAAEKKIEVGFDESLN
jgi:hypothetical protein